MKKANAIQLLSVCLCLLFISSPVMGATPEDTEESAISTNSSTGPSSLRPLKGLTAGIDFSFWWSTYWNQEHQYGPGINVGFPLLSDRLEILFKMGMMMGDNTHMIPVELLAKVPIRVTENFSPYMKLGPMVARKVKEEAPSLDFYVAAGAGMDLFFGRDDWVFYLDFDYCYQVSTHVFEENEHIQMLGFSTGVNYLF